MTRASTHFSFDDFARFVIARLQYEIKDIRGCGESRESMLLFNEIYWNL